MNTSEKHLLYGMIGYLVMVARGNHSMDQILSTLGHDITGHRSGDQYFYPRVATYASMGEAIATDYAEQLPHGPAQGGR